MFYTSLVFKQLILGIAINGLSLYGVTYLLSDIQYRGGFAFFALGGLLMGFINWIIKPVLKILTLPLHILTLGLSLIVINGVLFWLFDQVIDALAIDGIILLVPNIKTYFIAGILFGIINWLIHLIIPNK